MNVPTGLRSGALPSSSRTKDASALLSEDELDDPEYLEKLERMGQRSEYKEFKKQHPVSKNIPEELAQDWYFFENRLRHFNYEMIKPMLA